MNILIIPEDFRKDQYLLKPLIVGLLADLGKPRARVIVCQNPLLGGISEALKSDRLKEIMEMYPMVDIFILCVDRDGIIRRRDRLDQIEVEFGGKKAFLAENAWEEIETWTLAGLDLPATWEWNKIRSDVSVKESYFEKIAILRKVHDGPGGGRRALGELAAKRIDAIMLKCPEDFGALAARLKTVITDI